MVLHAIPHPLPTTRLISPQVVLARAPRIQTECYASELWPPRYGVRVLRAEHLERLGGVVPDPKRVPEGITESFGVESKGLDVGHVFELLAHAAAERPG